MEVTSQEIREESDTGQRTLRSKKPTAMDFLFESMKEKKKKKSTKEEEVPGNSGKTSEDIFQENQGKDLKSNRFAILESDSENEVIPDTQEEKGKIVKNTNPDPEDMDFLTASQTENVQIKRRLSAENVQGIEAKREKGTDEGNGTSYEQGIE
nr:PREDICTED: uncharacterized protein LOC106706872 [Latimeria chalumnae]|eukprot:XP_014353886.1 PREDICTED: uncharacterized protein LOC106706872 [Latimeria chalumnae]